MEINRINLFTREKNIDINHQNTNLKVETKNQASNRRHVVSCGSSLQSHPVWVTLHFFGARNGQILHWFSRMVSFYSS